ncbi:MAG: SDR family oxidoreductase [Gemmatimonadales bacterium]|nr:MAG: SDR family oxidoreductase [Gemmatimonadales bacterium]
MTPDTPSTPDAAPDTPSSGLASLAGRTALVTGATKGIGRATAMALAAAGVRLGLVARTREDLEALAAELAEEAGGGAPGGAGDAPGADATPGDERPADATPAPVHFVLPCDVSRPESVEATVRAFAEQTGGPPDLVVASAGVFTLGAIHETDPSTLDLNLDVNLKGSFLLVRAVLPGMLERGSGDIVQVGSISGRKAFPGNGAYSASKFGLRGLHEVLLEELRGTGVRATLVEPAATDTTIWDPMDPDQDPNLPPRAAMLRPEDVADAIVWAASRRPGVHIPVLPVEPA